MATMIHKIAQEVEQSSRQSNHTVKGRDYHDNNRDYYDNTEYPYTRDAVVSCNHGNTVAMATV